MEYPGAVYYLPPEAHGGDPDMHPHVLMTSISEWSETASFLFCSTKGTEVGFGAPHVLINPYATSYRNTGLRDATFVYPSRIVAVDPGELSHLRLAGRIIDEMPEIRRRLHEALGIDTGSCASAKSAAAGSLRGRVLQLERLARERSGCEYVVAVCSPEYASNQRYVNVLPVYDGDAYDPSDGDVIVDDGPWLSGMPFSRAILPTNLVQSVFFPVDVSRPMHCALDDAGMTEVDVALKLHFGLR